MRAGWHEHDAGVALIAQGVALLANCAAVEDADTAALIVDLAGQVSALLPGFSIKQRASL
ncbi:DNA methylase [Bordetella pertussis]|nr:DNA methylase [Bordetella pertussis]